MKSYIKLALVGWLVISLSACSTPKSEPNPTESIPRSSSPVPTETLSEAKKKITTEDTPNVEQEPSTTPNPAISRIEVNWSDYSEGTKESIDQMVAARDCTGIQSFFGMATATEESVKARTGHGNENLISYLNESLQIAQCG